MYSRRKGTEDIFDFLIEKTGILVLHAVRHLSSNRNRRQPEYNRELAKLHPDCILELDLIEKVKRESQRPLGSHQEVQIQEEEEALKAQKRQQKEKGRGKLRI